MSSQVLVVFGGLPGTGKTTIARKVARRIRAVYLRIDVIEQALRNSGVLRDEVGPAGYVVAYDLARANLRLGQSVVADSVNPLPVTRGTWRTVAAEISCNILEIEVICSNEQEHRRRVENRSGDIPGHVPPSWEQVQSHDYSAWTTPRLVLDTAFQSVDDLVSQVCLEF